MTGGQPHSLWVSSFAKGCTVPGTLWRLVLTESAAVPPGAWGRTNNVVNFGQAHFQIRITLTPGKDIIGDMPHKQNVPPRQEI